MSISKKDVQNFGIKILDFKISSLSNSEAALNVLSTHKAIPQCIVKFLIQDGNLDFLSYFKMINACRNKFYTIFFCLEQKCSRNYQIILTQMFYSELFTSSDSELHFSMETILMSS